MIDLYHQRRGKFREITYWKRIEGREYQNINGNTARFITQTGEVEKWILQNQPAGSVYVNEVSQLNSQGNSIGNVFMVDKNTITLCTNDECDDLEKGCIVMYNGKVWMVDNVQREIHINESEFVGEHYITYFNIRR